MRLLKLLVGAMLVVLPFGELFRLDLGNDIYFKPLDGLAILLLGWVTILYVKNKSWRASLKPYYFYFPLIGLAALLINSFWLQPKEVFVSSLYLIRWLGYMSIFFAVIQFDEKFQNKLQKFLIVDGIIVLVIGFLQFFLYPSLRNLYYLGWDEHLYRLFSSFLDPNFAGTFLVLYFIFLLGVFFKRESSRHSGLSRISHVKQNGFWMRLWLTRMTKTELGLLFLLATTLIAIFLTFSRSAFLMLLVSGVTFFLLQQKKKLILLLISAFIAFVLIISPFFYIENLNLFRINSSLSRLESSQRALQVIRDHPIIGVGFDSYRYAQAKYHFQKEPSKFPDHANAGVDMSLLFIFATTGVVGLFAYCYLWFKLLKHAHQKKKEGAVAFASGIGLFVNALFINSLFYPAMMLWMWLLFGLLFKKEKT